MIIKMESCLLFV